MPLAEGSAPPPWANAQGFTRLVLHGSAASRHAAAERLLELGDPTWWKLLAATIQSSEDWRLRARCLEVLGVAAGAATEPTVEAILNALFNLPDASDG